MATDTKAPRKVRVVAPAFDYSSIKATETDSVSRGGVPAVLATPFPGLMAESRTSGKAKVITIPKANRVQALTFIRTAAELAGHGVRTSVVDKGANVEITFQAKDKRQYNGRKAK